MSEQLVTYIAVGLLIVGVIAFIIILKKQGGSNNSQKNKSINSNSTNLFFKSNEACYEYSKKYFSSVILKNKSSVLGIVYLIGPDKKSGTVRCTVYIDSKQTEILIMVFFDDLEHSINIGDFVSVGINDIGKVFTVKDFEDTVEEGNPEGLKNLKDATIGVIIEKLTTELDIKSGFFIPFK
jgi:hypothetical protein|tara:strand:- start:205 stop:747 length:543 start_codon:yes stop_codon:yes gene_type:complete